MSAEAFIKPEVVSLFKEINVMVGQPACIVSDQIVYFMVYCHNSPPGLIDVVSDFFKIHSIVPLADILMLPPFFLMSRKEMQQVKIISRTCWSEPA
jgi:hypothetical protein